MSKKSKAQAQQKRLRAKRNEKAKQKARYQDFRDRGINTKSKRARKNAAKDKAPTVGHSSGKCGNVGCIACSGVNYKPFLNSSRKPEGMPQWMYLRWKDRVK